MEQRIMEVLRRMQPVLEDEELRELKNVLHMVFAGCDVAQKGGKMKLIFNDATELTIQSAEIRQDGSLMIKTISDTEENLKTIFQDGFKTKKMIIKERESTIGTYENYTELEGIMIYTAGILGVVLHKVGKSQLERIDALEMTTDDIILMMADLIAGGEQNENTAVSN